jgi:hypothetical protein
MLVGTVGVNRLAYSCVVNTKGVAPAYQGRRRPRVSILTNVYHGVTTGTDEKFVITSEAKPEGGT